MSTKTQTDETVFEIPEFTKYLKNNKYLISHYERHQWDTGVTRETLFLQKQEFLKLVRELSVRDLRILFYVKNLDGFSTHAFLKALQSYYQAQCDFKNAVYKTDTFRDPIHIGGIKYVKD